MPCQVRVVVGVVLFFGLMYTAVAQTNNAALPAGELQLVLAQVRALQSQAAERETVIRALQESLTVARAENELWQRQWAEAQLRAQTLGANPTDREAVAVHRQLTEAMRRLAAAETGQQRLMAQLGTLIGAVQSNANVGVEVARTQVLLDALAETSRAVNGPAGALAEARVVDVNAALRVVALDVGSAQGARVGMPLQVWRGDRLIAELRVVEVRPRVSGALLERVERGWTVQVGDRVRVTGSQMELKR